MEAIVLAGGLGTRLKAIVPDVPKPMAPVNGRPFLEYLLDYWVGQGVDRFILSVGYKHEVVEQHFGDRYKDAGITYAVEDRPRGTGGGLLLALEFLRQADPFLIMNGDTFFEVELEGMRSFYEHVDAEIVIALREMKGNSRYAGVSLDEEGRIVAFDSGARTADRALINGGVYLTRQSAFSGMVMPADVSLSIEERLYPDLLAAGRRLYGYSSAGRFIDIGVPEDYRRAATMLSRS